LLFYILPFCRDFIYQPSDINEATHFKVIKISKNNYGNDSNNSYTIIPAVDIQLPNISNSNILGNFTTNVNSLKIKSFKYKLFTYIYSPLTRSFNSLIFELNGSSNILINKKFLCGLSKNEVEYQYKLYGACELDIEIDSIIKLLKKEFKDPFYLFQFFAVILWLNNQYVNYALVILTVTIISIGIGVRETRKNLLNIQDMTKMDIGKIRIIRNFEVKIIY
jgi:hypothetical protein